MNDKYSESLVNGDSEAYFQAQLEDFKNDPSFPLYQDFELQCLIEGDDMDIQKKIKYSIENDPKNPLFQMVEIDDEKKDKIINELISLYKKLHLEVNHGITMSKAAKTRLRLIDQLARNNIKTKWLAYKLFESYKEKLTS